MPSRLHAHISRQPRWLLAWLLGLLLVLGGCANLPANDQQTPSYALPMQQATPLGQLAGQLRQQSGSRHTTGFRLLGSADTAFSARLALTQQAQRTLDLQYYAIHADASTRELLLAVREAAARGVRVRILLDDFNTQGPDAQVLQLAFVPGVEIRLFNPIRGPRSNGFLRILSSLHDFKRMQHRMHNKLFLADNAFGITGGRNLGDVYFGQGDRSNFIDLDVLATGQQVRAMSASFDKYWNNPLAYPVETLLSKKEIAALTPASGSSEPAADSHGIGPTQTTPAQRSFPQAMELASQPWIWAPSVLLSDSPAKLDPEDHSSDDVPTVVEGLLDMMQQARQQITIVSPYFVPGDKMMERFAELRQRGVKIVVLTNSLSSTDAAFAHIGYARYRERLLALGVQLYEMRALQQSSVRSAFGSSGSPSRASLHSKLVIVDGRILSIGSMNLDLRSKLQNTEVALIIRSRALSREITERMQPLLDNGTWKVLQQPDGSLLWQLQPPGSGPDQLKDPDSSALLRSILWIISPLAPDELL